MGLKKERKHAPFCFVNGDPALDNLRRLTNY